jgi:hypothetical protein
MPVLLTQGDADTVVAVDYARRWIGAMKRLEDELQIPRNTRRRSRQDHRENDAGHLQVLHRAHKLANVYPNADRAPPIGQRPDMRGAYRSTGRSRPLN